MAFSILGSILSRLCDSFSCSFGSLCNCSQTRIIVLGENSPAARDIIGICQRNQNLSDALKQAEQQQLENLRIRRVTQLQDSESITNRAAVLHIVQSSLNLLSGVSRLRCENERMVRLSTAARLAGLENLDNYYRDSTAITEDEVKKLRHQLRRIQKYGSSAAYLWKILKDYIQVDRENLSGMNISPKQIVLLEKIFKEKDKLNQNSFAQLETGLQNTFLQAAKHFTKKEIAQHGFVSWILPHSKPNDSADSSETVPSASSSEHFRLLIADLGIRGEMGIPMDKNNRLGFKRVSLLHSLIETDENMPDDLSDTQIFHLREQMKRLQELDGMIFYLFLALRDTVEVSSLKGKYELSLQICQEIKTNLKLYPDLVTELREVEDLSSLSINNLRSLYKIADKGSNHFISQLAQKYPLRCWISAPPKIAIERRKSDPN